MVRKITTSREANDLHATLNTSDKPLKALSKDDLSPGSVLLEKINASLR